MTVSFHKYGDFFPGTGALGDVGFGAGRHYSVNVPLQEGVDDDSYAFVFEPIMQKARAARWAVLFWQRPGSCVSVHEAAARVASMSLHRPAWLQASQRLVLHPLTHGQRKGASHACSRQACWRPANVCGGD